jgi:group I intron endonuclease
MPRLPIDYFNTIIYKIVCNDLSITDCYVGSTTDFTRRKAGHKSDCKKMKGLVKLYTFITLHGGWDNWSMVQIEEYPCMNSNEKFKRERFWIEEMKSSLNQSKPSRTKKEWTGDNIEKVRGYKQKYNLEHKEDYKIWAEKNEEKLKLYHKNWWEKNKDTVNEKRRLRRLNICLELSPA